jgi:hypothetical protein
MVSMTQARDCLPKGKRFYRTPVRIILTLSCQSVCHQQYARAGQAIVAVMRGSSPTSERVDDRLAAFDGARRAAQIAGAVSGLRQHLLDRAQHTRRCLMLAQMIQHQ